jgi:DNA mismatch endonuclease (patch repair protein)
LASNGRPLPRKSRRKSRSLSSQVSVPQPSSQAARRRMQRQRQRDTLPEIRLRSELHRLGLRFRLQYEVPGLRRRVDIVFRGPKLAVFCDGCYWHGCPVHGTWPKANAAWWRTKIETNQNRDRQTDMHLQAKGWTVVRVWEHEDPGEAAQRIAGFLRAPSSKKRSAPDRS